MRIRLVYRGVTIAVIDIPGLQIIVEPDQGGGEQAPLPATAPVTVGVEVGAEQVSTEEPTPPPAITAQPPPAQAPTAPAGEEGEVMEDEPLEAFTEEEIERVREAVERGGVEAGEAVMAGGGGEEEEEEVKLPVEGEKEAVLEKLRKYFMEVSEREEAG